MKLEKLIISILFGAAFPMLFFMLSVVFWFYTTQNEQVIIWYIGTGIIIGLIVDLIFLKRLVHNRFNLNNRFTAGIYLFYNIILYGMFMGFPVFNLVLGIVAGYYSAKRIRFHKLTLEQQKIAIRRVSIFTGVVMLLVCISTFLMVMLSEGSETEIQHMFGLGFEITRPTLVVTLLVGSIFLVLVQSYLTKMAIIQTLKKEHR